MNYYYYTENFKLINGDTFEVLDNIEEKIINLIFADPPYFLSSGGISCKSGKQVVVDKGEWDLSLSIKEKIAFHRKWISKCKRVLKDDGTIWISSTLHSVYAIGVALEMEGFSIINNVIWKKTNPAPNLACRCFTHSTETIIWARKLINGKKAKHTFNYNLMKELNGGKQMKDVWNIEEDIWEYPTTPRSEKEFGYHPTQKPLKLLERIILASSNEMDIILDPFNGSGTTGIAAIKNNRRYIGIDFNIDYLDITIKRYNKLIGEKNEKKL